MNLEDAIACGESRLIELGYMIAPAELMGKRIRLIVEPDGKEEGLL